MTPRFPSPDVILQRLITIDEALEHLALLRGSTVDSLAAAPIERAAVERLLQVVVDSAIDLNAHLLVASGRRAPESGRRSFEQVGTIGVIDAGLAERLAPSAGLRNVLVHRYADIRLGDVAVAIETVLEGFSEYRRQVSIWLATVERES